MMKSNTNWAEAGPSDIPKSYADVAVLIRGLGSIEASGARRARSHALARMIEQLDEPEVQGPQGEVVTDQNGENRRLRLQDVAAARSFRRYLDLRSAGATTLLLWLADHPDIFHSRTLIEEKLDRAGSSLKVFVWEIRRSFRSKGLHDPIHTVYGKGYCMPIEAAHTVRRLRAAIMEHGPAPAILDPIVSPLRRDI